MILNVIDESFIMKDLHKFINVHAKAISYSMNRANISGRTASSLVTRKEWVGIRARDMKKYTHLSKATQINLKTEYFVSSRPTNLADYGAVQKKKGVSYRLKKKRRTMKGSFLTKNGFVLKRTTTKRDSVKSYFSITATSMVEEQKADVVYVKKYFEQFYKEYDKNISFLFNK